MAIVTRSLRGVARSLSGVAALLASDALDPLLDRIDAYCDAAPRLAARTEELGPLILFVAGGAGRPFYARPRRGVARATAGAIREVRARQRGLGVPEAFEWIDEVSPAMRPAALKAGLRVHDLPLMVFGDAPASGPRPPLHGIELRLVTPEDDIATIASVAAIASSHAGTAVADEGQGERRRASERARERDEFERERLGSGATVLAAALLDGMPVATGVHQPVGDVTEVAGVATLPAFRRRGLGAAVTAFLVEDARRRGLATIFLSAGSEEIARLYGGLGFRRVGTACAADPG